MWLRTFWKLNLSFLIFLNFEPFKVELACSGQYLVFGVFSTPKWYSLYFELWWSWDYFSHILDLCLDLAAFLGFLWWVPVFSSLKEFQWCTPWNYFILEWWPSPSPAWWTAWIYLFVEPVFRSWSSPSMFSCQKIYSWTGVFWKSSPGRFICGSCSTSSSSASSGNVNGRCSVSSASSS